MPTVTKQPSMDQQDLQDIHKLFYALLIHVRLHINMLWFSQSLEYIGTNTNTLCVGCIETTYFIN
jgi:hypothetical protein